LSKPPGGVRLARVQGPISLAGLTAARAVALARERLPRGAGAARAIYRDAMRAGRFEPERHGLGSEACALWREHFTLALPQCARVSTEPTPNGLTNKLVLRLHDGLECESVRLPMGQERATLCISSQVGCKIRWAAASAKRGAWAFCAT
jgi:adenine C2-methylase RlmN of 23S rRNA A2503 and tRNA A37